MEWLDGNKIQIIPPKRPKKLTGTRFATMTVVEMEVADDAE